MQRRWITVLTVLLVLASGAAGWSWWSDGQQAGAQPPDEEVDEQLSRVKRSIWISASDFCED